MGRPKRIQLRRVKGWRMPAGARSCARPGPYGNPFTVAAALDVDMATDEADAQALCVMAHRSCMVKGEASEWWFINGAERLTWQRDHLHELAGLDLACWCKPGTPCHVDTYLDLANPRPSPSPSGTESRPDP